MSDSRILVHPTPEALAEAAAERFVRLTDRRQHLRVALPGGSTPILFFKALARKLPLSEDRIDFFLGDERCVPAADPDANAGAALKHLLTPLAIPAGRIHMPPATHPHAADLYAEKIGNVFETDGNGPPPAFDLILLGMGEDGHTASLFPGIPELEEKNRWVAHARAPVAPHERITFTLPILNAARRIWILAAGGKKAVRIREARSPLSTLPVSRVRGTKETLWWLDEAAASELDGKNRGAPDVPSEENERTP